MDIVNLIVILVLIAFTAFFVAAEFAIVKVRSSRMDQLIIEGSKRALIVKKVISNLDEYLSACQLGITITALGLGWLGEPAVEQWIYPLLGVFNMPSSLSHLLSFILAFSIVTFLHVVVGELAPKTFAIYKAEEISLWVSRPLRWFYYVMFPFIWLLNGSSRVLTGLFGLKPSSEQDLAHSEEELRIILSDSLKSGEINSAEYRYVNKIFEFDNRIAKEIMIPRTEMIALTTETKFDKFIEIVLKEQFTRYPIVDGDKDHIVGMINIKEVFTDLVKVKKEARGKIDLNSYIRPVIEVIDSIPIYDLLKKMQKERIHLAILMDEYGGTSGLVTTEDILEEIVGEIRDEFDQDEIPSIQKKGDNHYILDGKVLIEEVNELLGINIDEDDLDTIGGWIMKNNFEIRTGQVINAERYEFKVLQTDGKLVKRIEVKINQPLPVITMHEQIRPSQKEILIQSKISDL
ncbi:hemolysin family protein [Metabacillus arenae]|uniref:HlyC/CorC family transporter n=1 Tax=Metabacillus arenae TaxID=2771434 RepID=A0A926NG03_9BACI|nr:hemolysin family protein [Metabacillus arenae]MBD1380859.1 HlyC/CorC family transporter [Metabacillus arenae]